MKQTLTFSFGIALLLQVFVPAFADDIPTASVVVAPVVRKSVPEASGSGAEAAARERREAARALNNKGVAILNAKNYTEAIQLFEEGLRQYPDDTRMRVNLAIACNNFALSFRSEPVKAMILLHKAALFDSNNPTTIGNLNDMIKKIGKDPTDFATRVALGNDALNSGDAISAIVEYAQALKIKLDGPLCVKLANLYRDRGSFAEAGAAFEKASIIDKSVSLDLKGAQCYLDGNDIPNAVAGFKRVLKQEPNNVDAQYGLVKAWEAAIKNNPDAPENHVGLAQSFIARKDYDRARAELKMALAVAPKDKFANVDELLKSIEKKHAQEAMPAYLLTVSRQLHRNWFPPRDGMDGSKFELQILRDGRVARSVLIHSSGMGISDQAAQQAIDRASQFPPLPEGAPDVLSLEYTFTYKMGKDLEIPRIVEQASAAPLSNTSSKTPP